LYRENLSAITIRHSKILGDSFGNVIKKFSKFLRKLDLQVIGDFAARQISYCINLTELQLQGSDISEKTLNEIAERCKQLVVVGFTGCPITDTTMKILLHPESTRRRNFHSLLLSSCDKLTTHTMTWICRHTDLRVLRLSKCPWVTQYGLLQVAKCCKRIQHLDITHTLIRQQDIEDEEIVNSAIEILHDLKEVLPMAVIDSDIGDNEIRKDSRKRITMTNRF